MFWLEMSKFAYLSAVENDSIVQHSTYKVHRYMLLFLLFHPSLGLKLFQANMYILHIRRKTPAPVVSQMPCSITSRYR